MAKVLNIYKDGQKIGSGEVPLHIALDDGVYPAGTFKGSFLEGDKESDKVDFPAVTVKHSVEATGITTQQTASIKVGSDKDITVSVVPADATNATDVLAAVKWSSEDEAIATVADGKITAIAVGSTKVTATSGTFTSVITVTVTAAA